MTEEQFIGINDTAPAKPLHISNGGKDLVSVHEDGTVEVHFEGADKEAALVFWEHVQFRGATLHARIQSQHKVMRQLYDLTQKAKRHVQWAASMGFAGGLAFGIMLTMLAFLSRGALL